MSNIKCSIKVIKNERKTKEKMWDFHLHQTIKIYNMCIRFEKIEANKYWETEDQTVV